MHEISVVMPTFNSEKHISEAIDSIIAQSYCDWELIIVNEFGSDDKTARIVEEYQLKDNRIKFVQNKKRLGLAESLNVGIQIAEGKYIARMDADDISHSDRFEKQHHFMEEHLDVVLCGAGQHYFGNYKNRIHMPATGIQQCKANLLFFCDICHSTVMFRRDFFLMHNLLYDSHYAAEDYELWTRVIQIGNIDNIPEVLVEYRCDNNITMNKIDRLQKESGHIVASTIKRVFSLNIKIEDESLLCNWKNLYQIEKNHIRKDEKLKRLQKLLIEIYDANRTIKFCDEKALLKAINAKWNWAKYYFPFNYMKKVDDIDEIFKKKPYNPLWIRTFFYLKDNKGLLNKIVGLYKKVMR